MKIIIKVKNDFNLKFYYESNKNLHDISEQLGLVIFSLIKDEKIVLTIRDRSCN